ncbi:MAG: PocR ligand-binding domain-containing protein [Deltaproteobacteria bacterium]|nr:PocR ligand-binding domain-containing protein [Deltaproteobacteria bacterium]
MTADTRQPAPPAPDLGTSVLARRVTLADLLEGDSFKEVMTAFADLYRVGVKVFDASGHKLVDIRVGNSQFCGYLWEFGATRQACTRLVTGLKNDPFATRDGVEVARTVDCFSGLRYVVLPLLYEGDLIGRLIFGPYMPQSTPRLPDQLYQIEPKLDRQRADALIEQVRRAPDDLVAKLLTNVQKIVDVLVFTSYRSMLTSQMHIESVTASYHELEAKNRTLKENNERLQELDKLKSNFLATVSHELRTPLTSVIGYSEMLLEGMAGGLNDEQRDYVKTIMEKGESLLSMISQILDLSRIESGNLRMDLSDFNVKDVLRHATTSVIPQCQKKGITLDVDIDGGLPFFRGDKDKIGQIVVNLLGNSVKFTPQGGRITLRGKLWTGPRRHKKRVADDGAAMLFDLADETFVRIDVQDSGVGIPPEKIERVFERFYQVDNTSTREYGGTGLGLSIVRSFVEAHKGEIFAASEVGKGSTFTVLLPVS